MTMLCCERYKKTRPKSTLLRHSQTSCSGGGGGAMPSCVRKVVNKRCNSLAGRKHSWLRLSGNSSWMCYYLSQALKICRHWTGEDRPQTRCCWNNIKPGNNSFRKAEIFSSCLCRMLYHEKLWLEFYIAMARLFLEALVISLQMKAFHFNVSLKKTMCTFSSNEFSDSHKSWWEVWANVKSKIIWILKVKKVHFKKSFQSNIC